MGSPIQHMHPLLSCRTPELHVLSFFQLTHRFETENSRKFVKGVEPSHNSNAWGPAWGVDAACGASTTSSCSQKHPPVSRHDLCDEWLECLLPQERWEQLDSHKDWCVRWWCLPTAALSLVFPADPTTHDWQPTVSVFPHQQADQLIAEFIDAVNAPVRWWWWDRLA